MSKRKPLPADRCVSCREHGKLSKTSKVCQDYTITLASGFPFYGVNVVIPNLEHEACSRCGERYFDHRAVDRIEFALGQERQRILLKALNENLEKSWELYQKNGHDAGFENLHGAVKVVAQALRHTRFF